MQTNKIEFHSGMEPELRDLIGKILIKEAKGRFSMDQIIEHAWIRSKGLCKVENLPKVASTISTNSSKQSPPDAQAVKSGQQPATSSLAGVPKLQLRKNALIN